MSIDKRRHPRFSVEGLQGAMLFTTPVEIVNMSMGGAAVRADLRLNIGREYLLKLEVEGESMAVKGVVVWSTLSGLRRNAQGEMVSQYSAGLRFLDLLSDRLSRLIGFIEQNKVNPEKRLSGLRFRIDERGRATIDSAQSYEVQLISLSGMLIRTEQDLSLEGLHPMEILPPDEEPIRFTGRVASSIEVEEDGPGFHEVGIEFIQLAPNDRARLEAYVATLARS
jgi:c-di-GMP-binding flagellar brake protein YcgR